MAMAGLEVLRTIFYQVISIALLFLCSAVHARQRIRPFVISALLSYAGSAHSSLGPHLFVISGLLSYARHAPYSTNSAHLASSRVNVYATHLPIAHFLLRFLRFFFVDGKMKGVQREGDKVGRRSVGVSLYIFYIPPQRIFFFVIWRICICIFLFLDE